MYPRPTDPPPPRWPAGGAGLRSAGFSPRCWAPTAMESIETHATNNESLLMTKVLSQLRATAARPGQPLPGRVEIEIHHRRRVQRQQLTRNQAADDGDPERPPQFGAGPGAQGQRQRAK